MVANGYSFGSYRPRVSGESGDGGRFCLSTFESCLLLIDRQTLVPLPSLIVVREDTAYC